MNTRLLALLISFLALTAAPFTAAAADSRIVDAAFVTAAIKRGAIIWDVRSGAEYRRSHIPEAISIGDALSVLRNPNSEDFMPVSELERILGDAGFDLEKEIVVYGTRAAVGAYFGLYTLQHFGAKKAWVYHDGIDGWARGSGALQTEEIRYRPVQLSLKAVPGVAVSTEEILAMLNKPDIQLIDVRTPGEFAGEDIRAIRGGHIPGAINIPYEQNWQDPETAQKLARRQVRDNSGMSLKSDADLRALYSKLDPDKETVVYCHSGVRAAETATVLAKLGFTKVKVYDSSWLGYGNKLDAPANNVQFFNVGAFNNRITALQSRIDQLEREVGEARRR